MKCHQCILIVTLTLLLLLITTWSGYNIYSNLATIKCFFGIHNIYLKEFSSENYDVNTEIQYNAKSLISNRKNNNRPSGQYVSKERLQKMDKFFFFFMRVSDQDGDFVLL